MRAISNSPDEADRSRWQIDAALGALAAAVARVLAENRSFP